MTPPNSVFSSLAHWTARQMGRGSTFALACLTVMGWAAVGPVFGYSDTWQLVINTGTTIVTFLMVFLLQHAQNRDAAAIQLKLDELIRVDRDARNKMLALEDLSEAELDRLKAAFSRLATGAGTDIDAARGELEDAKDGIEQAQSAVGRSKGIEP
ncbi:low affinity iron permease family protein [Lichenibacterium ramalinae]|nr:low affinity iron permease family protein [Lichenibacterium ramalinae]